MYGGDVAEVRSRDRDVGAACRVAFDRADAGHRRQLGSGDEHAQGAGADLVDGADARDLHRLQGLFFESGPELSFTAAAEGPHVPGALQRDAVVLPRRHRGHFGEATDLHGHVARCTGSVAELTAGTRSPGEDFAGGEGGQAVGLPGRDRVNADQALDRDGSVAAGFVAVPQLVALVLAPRLDGPVREQREAEFPAGGDRGDATEFGDFDGRLLAVAGRCVTAVAELPFLVRAPGFDPAVAEQREPVFATGRDRRHFAEPGDFDGHVGVVDATRLRAFLLRPLPRP